MGPVGIQRRGRMRTLVVFALALAAVQALNPDQEWEIFKAKYERKYLSTPEHDQRRSIFISNLRLIQKHNAEHALGLHTYTLGVNKFADLTSEEFVKTYNGFRPELHKELPKADLKAIGNEPDTVDWRPQGYVTPIKDQGQCGSCWAFSAVATMEGAWFKKSGSLISLSEQQLVDCDTAEDQGCNGGLPSNAINYVIANKGDDTEASYPYTARDGSCHFDAANVGATFTKLVQVESKSEEALKTATATIGPISVGIDASHFSFQLYSGGVYHSIFCSQTRLDHGVAVVGYGSDNGKDFWLVKNSWGESWGEQGYIKMSRNRNNNCGIATMACYAEA